MYVENHLSRLAQISLNERTKCSIFVCYIPQIVNTLIFMMLSTKFQYTILIYVLYIKYLSTFMLCK